MDLPLTLPVTPMLAKAATAVPAADAIAGGYAYEPKWDGFRVIVLRDGDQVELASRGSKPLTRYFPEVVAAALQHLPDRCALDGEIVVRAGEPGAQRLAFEALGQRIHPAESRVQMLAEQTPAEVIFFDTLVLDGLDLTERTFGERRAELESAMASVDSSSGFHLTRLTHDAALAKDWFTRFEGAGLDGVIAKPMSGSYQPGKRAMLKIKHSRTAEAVVLGYRVHKSGEGVGSLLLGMYDAQGRLLNVGGISAFPMARRRELIDELDELVERDADGEAATGATDRSRFSSNKDVSFVRLRPERVVEVKFDQLEGHRFRHTVTFLRWRPDREPASCLLEQVERAPAYDLDDVLG
ncbi:ATP-dependent DNA ligase [Dermacoccaceae bacterium W4C1]